MHADPRSSALRSTARRWAPHVVFSAVLCAVLELYGRSEDAPIPPVSDVVVALADIVADGSLPSALGESLQLLVIGFGLAAVAGVGAGILLGRYRIADRTVMPFLTALYALPTVALVPLILVWMGFGLAGRVTVVFLSCYFPIMMNVYSGVRNAPTELIEVSRSFLVRSEFGLLRVVIIPASVPFIMSGLRLGIGLGVVGMAVAEVYLRLGGIGALIASYGATFRLDYLVASILPLPLVGLALTHLFGFIERRASAWRVG
jgi:ABC-type nitrate/sulfonate/bicarbonate transport system permease component